MTNHRYRKAPIPDIQEGTSYSELYKPNARLDVDRYSAQKGSQHDRSFEQPRALTPPKELFYDETYDREKDPQFKRKMKERQNTMDIQRTNISERSSVNNDDGFNINLFKNMADNRMGKSAEFWEQKSQGSYMAALHGRPTAQGTLVHSS